MHESPKIPFGRKHLLLQSILLVMSLGLIREEEVITELSKVLEPFFTEVNIREYPDRLSPTKRQFPGLTTDSLIQLVRQDGDQRKEQLIAADVMVLALSRENLVAGDFHDVLNPIAQELGVNIKLTAESAVLRSEFAESQTDLSSKIRSSPVGGIFEIRPGISFEWSKSALRERATFEIVFLFTHAPSALLSDQIYAENASPLLRKTKPGGQVERALQSGTPYVLVLDGIGSAEVEQGMHFLADGPYTYQTGILKALGDRASLVSAIFLLNKNGEWSILKNDLECFSEISASIGV